MGVGVSARKASEDSDSSRAVNTRPKHEQEASTYLPAQLERHVVPLIKVASAAAAAAAAAARALVRRDGEFGERVRPMVHERSDVYPGAARGDHVVYLRHIP